MKACLGVCSLAECATDRRQKWNGQDRDFVMNVNRVKTVWIRMNVRTAWCACALALLAPPAWAQSSSEVISTRGLERLDFREVINSAKSKVFPTVVFIKCLRESFEGGKKVSVEVSGSGVLISRSEERRVGKECRL